MPLGCLPCQVNRLAARRTGYATPFTVFPAFSLAELSLFGD